MPALEPVAAAFAAACKYDDLRIPLRAVAEHARMQNFAALRLRGAGLSRLVQVVHTAPASHREQFEQPAYWHSLRGIREQLSGAPPTFYSNTADGPAEAAGFEHGCIISNAEQRGAVVLLLARPAQAIDRAEMMDILRPAIFSLVHLADCFDRLLQAACPLSSRQLDCLRHHMAGHTSAVTARELQLSARTVEEYLVRAREHLKAPNSLGAAMHAIDHGWITHSEVIALMAA